LLNTFCHIIYPVAGAALLDSISFFLFLGSVFCRMAYNLTTVPPRPEITIHYKTLIGSCTLPTATTTPV